MKRSICWLLIAVLLCTMCTGFASAADGEYTISEEGIAFIKSQEGFTSYRVWDNTQYSIGYGTACGAGDYPNGINREQADQLLRKSLARMEVTLNKFIAENNLPLGQAQYDALVSFTYNVGISWLKGCRLSRLLLSGQFTSNEFASAIGVWCHTGKSVAGGLVKRRVREIQLFLHGDYSGTNSPSYVYVLFDAAGGEVPTDICFYPKGSAYGVIQSATKANTKFLGWFKTDGSRLMESAIAEKNLRVTARWNNPHPASQAFTDLQDNAWYYGYVDDLYNGGVVDGYEDGSFRPAGTVTLGQALKMILLACDYPAQTPTPTDPGQWASGYRALAVNLGILALDEAKDLEAAADRAFIAKIAARGMKLTAQPATEEIFADTNDSDVIALFQHNIVLGSVAEDGHRYFYPAETITRAELCTIVSRIMNS